MRIPDIDPRSGGSLRSFSVHRVRPFPLGLLAVCILLLSPGTAAQTPAPQKVSGGARIVAPEPTVRARRYQTLGYTLYFLGTGWTWLGLWSFARRGWSRRWREQAERLTRRRFAQVAVTYALFSLALAIWTLPVSAAGALIEAHFGFSTRSLPGWLEDQACDYLVGLAGVPAVCVAYWLVGRSPRRWWLWLWVASITWLFVNRVLEPMIVAPLYNDFRPLPPGPLRDRLHALAVRAGIGDASLLVADASRRTHKQNAYVSGLGPSHRIVLWDNLVRESPPDQIEAVVAHEIGHYVLNHRRRQFVWEVVGAACILWILSRLLPIVFRRAAAGCGVRGLDDPAGLPLVALALSVVLFLQTPVAAAISRTYEREADRYGVALTGNGPAAARQLARFVSRDFADPDPPAFVVFWFYSHPPIRERIAAALSQPAGATHRMDRTTRPAAAPALGPRSSRDDRPAPWRPRSDRGRRTRRERSSTS